MAKAKKLLVALLSVVFAFSVISFLMATTVKADGEILIKDGAEVRIALDDAERNGIRFTGYVSDSIELDEDTFAGIEIVREDNAVLNIKAENYLENTQKDGYKTFTAVIYNIPETAYGEVFTAKAYLVVDGGDPVYTDAVSRSIAQVASAELADGADPLNVETLKGYVDPVANTAIVKVNDTTIESIQELTVSKGNTLTVSVSDNLTPVIATESTVLSISGNTISVDGYSSTTEIVTITVGNYMYSLQITINPWVDTAIGKYVLADFDEAEYVSRIAPIVNEGQETANAIIHLDESEAVGGRTGVAELPSISANRIQYRVAFKAHISDSVKAIAFKVYSTVALSGTNLRVQLRTSADAGNGNLVQVAVTANEWNEIVLPLSNFGTVSGDSYYLYFNVINKLESSVYVDEISYISNEIVYDENIKDNVLADFDEVEYLSKIDSIVGSNETAVNAKMHLDESEAIGGRTGIVEFPSISQNRIQYRVAFDKKMPGDVYAIAFKVYSTVALSGTNLRVQLRTSADAGNGNLVQVAVTANEWNEIVLPLSNLGTVSGDSYYLYFNVINKLESSVYVDDIVYITDEIVADKYLEENVVADFDEIQYYYNSAYVGRDSGANITGTTSLENGAVEFTQSSAVYGYASITLAKGFELSEISSISFKMKTDIDVSKLYLYMGGAESLDSAGPYIVTGGAWFSSKATTTTDGDWTIYTITYDDTMAGTVSGVISKMFIAFRGNRGSIYIDEISVTPKA